MTEFTREAAETILNENFAPWVRALDMRFDRIGDGEVVMVAPFAEDLVRQGGIMSGQAMMCLADTAMVFALLARAGYAHMAQRVRPNFWEAMESLDGRNGALLLRLLAEGRWR